MTVSTRTCRGVVISFFSDFLTCGSETIADNCSRDHGRRHDIPCARDPVTVLVTIVTKAARRLFVQGNSCKVMNVTKVATKVNKHNYNCIHRDEKHCYLSRSAKGEFR